MHELGPDHLEAALAREGHLVMSVEVPEVGEARVRIYRRGEGSGVGVMGAA